MRTIEVIIAPNGETKLETKGFQGAVCQAASAFLEAAIGLKTADQHTAEFFQAATAKQSLREGGNS